MTRFPLRAACAVVVSVAIAACQSGQAHVAEPAPQASREWSAFLVQAGQEVNAGRYAVADRLLSDFTTRFPASSEAVESMYWRAIYKLDPANQNASAQEASVLLDGYLASKQTAHRTEALTLRRLATVLESRVATTVTTTAVGTPPPRPEDKTKDEELQRLKDELAKANAELERIRRRLASPKP